MMNFSDINYHDPVVLFDLDDTLAKERDFITSGFRLTEETLHQFFDFPDGEIFNLLSEALINRRNYYDDLEAWIKQKDLSVELEPLMKKIVSEARAHFPDSKYNLRPQALGLLRKLQQRGIIMGLITDGRSVTQRNKVKALGLDDFFAPEMIFISGETGHDKHSPDNFEAVVRRYPEAKVFFYIGDNPEKDFLHPNLLGWKTFMLVDSKDEHIFPQPERDWPYSASENIHSLDDLLTFFKV